MYVPASISVSDENTLHDFIERYDFATLVSGSAAALTASHIPMVLQRSDEGMALIGHVARANAHWKHFDGGVEALAIFHGPHSYISPTWYATSPAVPTWNYAAVHVYGKPRATEDFEFTTAALKGLVARYETTRRTPWRMEDLDADFYTKLAAAVVAFEMPVDRIEGKFKLGQNRCREDRIGTLEGLKAEGAPESDALAEFIRQHAPVE
jgi:transcriptional regulator